MNEVILFFWLCTFTYYFRACISYNYDIFNIGDCTRAQLWKANTLSFAMSFSPFLTMIYFYCK